MTAAPRISRNGRSPGAIFLRSCAGSCGRMVEWHVAGDGIAHQIQSCDCPIKPAYVPLVRRPRGDF